jgi:adenosylhomocysteine nucleosidase
MRILILAALPQEYSPIKKLLPSWRLVRKRPLKKFICELPGKEIVLIESGMGARSAEEAFGAELTGFTPDLLIFSGFAGGLHPDLPVGAVCFTTSAREISSGQVFHFRFSDKLIDFMTQNGIRPVLGLSAEQPGNKRTLSALAAGQTAVLDMETATLARMAFQNKIPFVCFRAVSDALDHDLGFDLSDIADERGRIRLTGVLVAVIRKPATLKAFYLSWRRSRRAAKNLCRSVAAFLGIPTPVLDEMAGEIRIELS